MPETKKKAPAKETADKSASDNKKVKVDDAANLDDLKPGMTVRVYHRIKELNIKGEEKERTQYFDGMIIARKHGKEKGATITVRKISDGIGVEKIFPLNLPTIEKIVVKKQAEVRRAKLYYLRTYKKKLKEKTVIK